MDGSVRHLRYDIKGFGVGFSGTFAERKDAEGSLSLMEKCTWAGSEGTKGPLSGGLPMVKYEVCISGSDMVRRAVGHRLSHFKVTKVTAVSAFQWERVDTRSPL